ncbi:MAG TPA: hypothetical protein VK866_06895, partial [Acidimicrobiales bacterium]|nr:hypothetical protein [Acidimicrobiales bacterium]
DAVRRILRTTLVLGRPLPSMPAQHEYEALCLDWYLGPARRWASVLEDDGEVVGYLLLGADPSGQRRWVTRAVGRCLAALVRAGLTGQLSGDAARLVWLRLRDGWGLRRSTPPLPVHVHLNLVPSVRAGRGGRLLAARADDLCRELRAPGWYGEINAPAGRRASALERLGAEIVHRAPNRTLSWAAGTPVERLTVVRRLPAATAEPAA